MPSVKLVIGAKFSRIELLVPESSPWPCGGYIWGCGEAIVALFDRSRLLTSDAFLRWRIKGELLGSTFQCSIICTCSMKGGETRKARRLSHLRGFGLNRINLPAAKYVNNAYSGCNNNPGII